MAADDGLTVQAGDGLTIFPVCQRRWVGQLGLQSPGVHAKGVSRSARAERAVARRPEEHRVTAEGDRPAETARCRLRRILKALEAVPVPTFNI